VILADGKWSCEVTEPNTSTVCHPSIEAGGAAAAEPTQPEEAQYTLVYTDAEGVVYFVMQTADTSVVPKPETWTVRLTEPNTQTVCEAAATVSTGTGSLELYTLADEWLGCHVTLNYDDTYTVAYDYGGENNGIITDTGAWEKLDDNNAVLRSDSGEEYEVTIVTEPAKEGYAFAGWQTRPEVTKDDLVYGVSPYEVPTGASSLYGGAGTDFTGLESLSGNMLLLYARWVEVTEIHTVDDLRAMADDLCGSYVLAEDIDLSGENWTPIGMYFSNYETVNAPYWTYAFRGSFDGAGHTIKGLTIEQDSCKSRSEGYDASVAVWRNDGEALGSDVAFFGSTAEANIHDVSFEGASLTVNSGNDATPYVAVVNGFDLASTMTNIRVTGAVVNVTADDDSIAARPSAWAAVSAFCAGGWSTTIENCSVEDSTVTLNGKLTSAHGGEFYVGAMLGEGYAFMDGNSAQAAVMVDLEDACEAENDTELVVNVGGMGGTNTTQTGANTTRASTCASSSPSARRPSPSAA
jgi:hypothetical protein